MNVRRYSKQKGNQASRGVKGTAAAEGVPALEDQATGFLEKNLKQTHLKSLFPVLICFFF